MILSRTGGILGVAGAALLFSSVPAVAGAGVWTPVATPSATGVLFTVDARTDADAWAVGTAGIFRWNGTAWQAVSTAGLPAVRNPAVAAVSADDAWIVGAVGTGTYSRRTGTALHWDGTAWSVAAPVLPTGSELRGVAPVSANNVWAVGKLGPRSLVEHWNGAAWTQVTVPEPTPGQSNGLVSVSARAANDIWAVGTYIDTDSGNEPYSLHYDGTAWSVVAMPTAPQTPTFPTYTLNSVVAVATSDVWAVGQVSTGAPVETLVMHWNGAAWSVVAAPTPGLFPTVRSVAARAAGDIWAVGEIATDEQTPQHRTFTLHWDGVSWTHVASPPADAYSELYAVATRPGTSHVWAVGNNDAGAPFILERH